MAGVSVSTASLVLAGKSADRRISREVEERVRQIAHQQDYNPNLLVKSMQRGRTHVLSFYSSFRKREQNDLYMDRLSTAIQREAGARGYDILTYCDFSRPTDDFYQHLNGGLSDGLLFFGPSEGDSLLPLLRESRLPTVMILHEDTEAKLCSIVEDVEGGIVQIASALIAQGHTRIAAAVGPPQVVNDSQRRVELLRDALVPLGGRLEEEWVFPMTTDNRFPIENALRTILSFPDPPTALFCWHDRLGYRILEACDRLSIRVPESLSLVGYDGLHWPSTSPHILTSVAVDIDAAAAKAINILDQLINGETSPAQSYRLPVRWESGTTLGTARR
jgi:DNA-binding LacI/PurR family transcriptional regulator